MTSSRIPPPGEPLEFARNTKTGLVHILPYVDRYSLEPVDMEIGEALYQLFYTPRPMLCGAGLIFPSHVADFADEDLCIRCVQAFGDQQWRVFHADNRAG